MTVTKDDFEKIWASSSPLTPYSFTDSNYKEGWNFVGSTPPSRQMWDAFMQNADEKLKYLYQHEDVPLGHEYFTFNPNIPQGSLPLFGGEYDRATYSDLWNWVQQQTGYLKTEAEWQTLSASNNGNVPYYSDGDGSTTFRVPSLKCWVRGANGTVTEVGSYLEAGLPNITGGFDIRAISSDTGSVGNASGSFSISDIKSGLNVLQAISGTNFHNTVTINASDSSSIYGNANTVQPESIVGLWLVKAYGVIVDTGTIDEQQYIDDRIATRLPLAGGTMIGDVTFSNSNIRCADNASTFRIIGGTSGDYEPYLTLRGKDEGGTYAGTFVLQANDGTNSKRLAGYPSGTLTWGCKEVERVNASGTNYIRYESGLQICWGSTSADSSGKAVTFPVAFSGIPSISVVNSLSSVHCYFTNLSATGVTLVNNSSTSYAIRYTATGYWK